MYFVQIDVSGEDWNVQEGDMLGFTWTNYGVIPFDYNSGEFNYYEQNINPSEGQTFTLVANRHGNRFVYFFKVS